MTDHVDLDVDPVIHEDGKTCHLTTSGRWVEAFKGLTETATCHRDHDDRQARSRLAACKLASAARKAADLVASGEADSLVVLDHHCPAIPGEQGDDDVRAVAAIDVLRHLVETYEAENA